jgi:hypothetical protein
MGSMTVSDSKGSDAKRYLVPALIAAGSSFALNSAHALELGEAEVRSTLGQPLSASIAYALGPNEELAAYCISLVPAATAGGIPAITNAGISVANGVIALTGKAAIRDPLTSIRVSIRCPYSPRITRDYTLFIDPPSAIQQADKAPVQATGEQAVAVAAKNPAASTAAVAHKAPAPAPAIVHTPAASTDPVDSSERYRVQPGDSLSQIAERIENRPVTLWSAVTQIHAANPDAFIDNDPNKLKAGSWLTIPRFGSTDTFSQAPIAQTAASSAHIVDPQAWPAPEAASTTTELPAEVAYTEIEEATDIIAPIELRESLRETRIEATSRATTPNVPIARIAPPMEPASRSGNSIWWLIGGGIALLGGLLVFGRRRSDSFAPEPVAPVADHPLRRAGDTNNLPTLVSDDFDLRDDSPTVENLALSAELELAEQLDGGVDIIVDESFSVSAAAPLDLELPDESGAIIDSPDTDIISPPKIETSSILEREVLPSDDDYDMSVLMDVTKASTPDEVTEKDLMAIAVEHDDDTEITDAYTVSQEIDYQVLEQDYEDELSATQALNLEIEKAAADLARKVDEFEEEIEIDEIAMTDRSPRPHLASVTSLEPTARLASESDNSADENDTGRLEVLAEDDTLNEELTAELRSANDDETAVMPIEPGKVSKIRFGKTKAS